MKSYKNYSIVYKVVTNESKSTNGGTGSLSIDYSVKGKWIFPAIGKFFVFTSLADARNYKNNISSQKILVCLAKDVTVPQIPRLDLYGVNLEPALQALWSGDLSKASSIAPVTYVYPEGTRFASQLMVIDEITKKNANDEYSLVFKALSVTKNDVLQSYAIAGNNQLVYRKNRWTLPVIEGSKLFVYPAEDECRGKICKMVLAVGVHVHTPLTPYRVDINASLEVITKYWTDYNRGAYIDTGYFIPAGTQFADRVFTTDIDTKTL